MQNQKPYELRHIFQNSQQAITLGSKNFGSAWLITDIIANKWIHMTLPLTPPSVLGCF